jgi:tetratricopeptide (TPR) repeat protein
MADPSLERIKSLEQRLAKEPQSPLFARLADYYLQMGRANDALRLCDDGLALYPYYTTAHLIKAKVLNQLGMTAEAGHAYEVVREFLPTNESVLRLTSIVDRGPSQAQEVSEADEEVVQAEPPQAPVQQTVHKEIAAEEALPTTIEEPQATPVEDVSPQEPVAIEEPMAQAEEPPVQETIVEEQPVETVEAAPTTDDSFGFGEQPVVEPQPKEPGAAEKLGLEMQAEPQQTYSDFGFGAPAEEPPAAAVEETPFGSQPIEESPRAIEPEPEQVPEPPPFEAPAMEAAPAASPEATADQPPDWFEAFSQLQQPAAETAETPAAQAAEEEDPFAIFGTEQSSATVEGEPYEEFTARVRMELFGTEDTMTLDEYLAQTGSFGPPAAPSDNIGELAEKLKTSQRITPPVINFSEKAPRSASGADAGGGSGFVTPTLAEIYVKQGWFDDAIKAYRALAANKPAEKEKFEQRITEIEEMKKK